MINNFNHKKSITMKKVLTLTLFAAILFGSCEKEGKGTTSQEISRNRVIVLPSDGKAGNSTILLVNLGHDGKTCKGCIWDGGRLIHENCMGDGNYCAKTAAVQLQQIGSEIFATTTDTFDLTSEDFFLMPDRSLSYTGEKGSSAFLNIPEQLVYRDTATLQFTFTGLFFSETAAYSNN